MYLEVEKGLGTQMQAEVAVLRYVGNYVTAMSIQRHVSYRKTVSCRVPVSALAFQRSRHKLTWRGTATTIEGRLLDV